jgi:hypothetical protein
MVFSNNLLMGVAGQDGGYEIEYSARLTIDNSFLKATTDFNGSGNTQYWTVSFWAKRADLTKFGALHSSTVGGNPYYQDVLAWNSGANLNKITAYYGSNASGFTEHNSSGVYRDPSAWAHYCIQNNNFGVTVWVNNEVALSFTHGGSYRYLISSSFDYRINNYEYQSTPNGTTDWYIADYYLILDSSFGASDIYGPDQFGEYNDDGVWVPKENSLTTAQFGEDGCFMEFKQSGTSGATASDIGADTSGQDNHMQLVGTWTSDDQVTDTPTDNYATLNPLDIRATTYTTIGVSNGNLELDYKLGNAARSAFGDTLGGGKWVFEGTLLTAVGGSAYIGWSALNADLNNIVTQGPVVNYRDDGTNYVSSTSGTGAPTSSAYGATYTNGDVIRVEADFTASTVEFFKNGTSQGSIDISGMNDGTVDYFPNVYGNNAKWGVNFGQQPFIGTPTAGYKALSTANLPTPTIKDGSKYFQTTLYTGDGNATQTITQSENSTFNPDLVWIKNRSNAYAHNVNDAVRGYTGASPATAADVKVLASDATDKEGLGDALTTAIQRGFVQSSTSNGFIVNKGTAGSQDGFYTNASGHTYAAWQWLAANGTASNTNGSITSTVSANTTAGFSIVGYTGITGGGTIGHGLSDVPDFIVVKHRPGTDRWTVFHTDTSDAYTYLNENFAAETANAALRFGNGTVVVQPTSSVFTIGTSTDVNTNGNDYIAYCWHSVEGFSKFGKYTGNGSLDGPFVWCGFRPSFLMVKRTDVASDWFMLDNQRPGYNVIGGGGVGQLPANLTYAESSLSTYAIVDFLSNGFKVRHDMTYGYWNASGGTYIFMAFAEHCFGGDGVAPVPAR